MIIVEKICLLWEGVISIGRCYVFADGLIFKYVEKPHASRKYENLLHTEKSLIFHGKFLYLRRKL